MLEVNDIIQIVDKNHPWYSCLLIVDEVKSWGVQAFCIIPESNIERRNSFAFNRLNNGQIVKVGNSSIPFGE